MIIYHNDLDGKCAAAIIKNVEPKLELYQIDNGDKFDWGRVKKRMYMVDFSLEREDMAKLSEQSEDTSKELVWIDHHKTSIEKCSGLKISGSREVGRGACELTWYYMHCSSIPVGVALLAQYDVWDTKGRFDWEREVLPFQEGMKLENTSPDSDIWLRIFYGMDVQNIIKNGTIVLKYQKSYNEEKAVNSYEIEFEGFRAIVLNRRGNSKMFDSVYDPKKHDLMIGYENVRGEYWRVSLYSDKIDVSLIAKKYGGGGHKGASGFQCEKLPF